MTLWYSREVTAVRQRCGRDMRLIMLLLWRLYGVTLKLELTPYWITTIAPGSEYSSVVVIVIITGQP